MLQKIFGGLILCIVVFVVSTKVFGHASGNSLEQKVGEYTVDVGYAADKFVAGEPVRFDVSVLDKNRNKIEFSQAWVRISKGNNTIFASGIARALVGETGLIYTFPEEGTYSLSIRFENTNTDIVKGVFDIVVNKGERKNEWLLYGSIFSAGCVLGALVLFSIRKRL